MSRSTPAATRLSFASAPHRALPYGCQTIESDDLDALVAAAGSSMITQGPAVGAFEAALAEFCGAPYAVAVSSGTAALHLAQLALGAGPGTVSLTSPLTFVASANAALYCRAAPRFADVDRATGNLDPRQLAAAILRQPAPTIVTAVHYAGLPADMPEIERLSRAVGALVIEDACHALGARYRTTRVDERGNSVDKWHRVGACDHSDLTCFSFHPVKHITTGEGGAITTRSEAIYKRLLQLRSHGIVRDPDLLVASEEERGPWYYEMQELGFNYRITDMQCALGRSQLAKLPSFLDRRRAIAARYRAALAGVEGLTLPAEPEGYDHAFHLYPLRFDEERLHKRRRTIFDELTASGIGVQVHYLPVHLQPFYRVHFGTRPGQFPEAENYYRQEISVPMFPRMTDAEVDRVIDAVRAAVTPRGSHR